MEAIPLKLRFVNRARDSRSVAVGSMGIGALVFAGVAGDRAVSSDYSRLALRHLLDGVLGGSEQVVVADFRSGEVWASAIFPSVAGRFIVGFLEDGSVTFSVGRPMASTEFASMADWAVGNLIMLPDGGSAFVEYRKHMIGLLADAVSAFAAVLEGAIPREYFLALAAGDEALVVRLLSVFEPAERIAGLHLGVLKTFDVDLHGIGPSLAAVGHVLDAVEEIAVCAVAAKRVRALLRLVARHYARVCKNYMRLTAAGSLGAQLF